MAKSHIFGADAVFLAPSALVSFYDREVHVEGIVGHEGYLEILDIQTEIHSVDECRACTGVAVDVRLVGAGHGDDRAVSTALPVGCADTVCAVAFAVSLNLSMVLLKNSSISLKHFLLSERNSYKTEAFCAMVFTLVPPSTIPTLYVVLQFSFLGTSHL